MKNINRLNHLLSIIVHITQAEERDRLIERIERKICNETIALLNRMETN